MNWTNYINYWDTYYSNWYLTNNVSSDPFFGGKSALCSYETPEPYYFGGAFPNDNESFQNNSIEAVILNINPGNAQANEWVKFWQHKYDPNAFIIANSPDYHTLNLNYNPLIASSPNIPGKVWWDKNRFAWIDRFITRSANRSQVFAIEPCPWHSSNANSIDYNYLNSNSAFRNYFQEYIIDPAADAIRASRLKGGLTNKPFGLWFGNNELRNILVNIFSFKISASWDQTSYLPSWPVNKNGKPIKRKYELLVGNDSCGKECRFLFLSYPNVGVYAPSKEFDPVDQYIKSKI